MKKLSIIIVLISSFTFAQFKDSGIPTETPKNGIFNRSSNFLFDFMNNENFSMKHSFSMSYSSFAGQGIALGVYTNSMMYKFSDNFNVQLDASIVNSPYSTLGKDFQNSLNGLYISRAALNYKPWDDVSITLQYRSLPFYFNYPYSGYRNYYSNPFFNDYFPEF